MIARVFLTIGLILLLADFTRLQTTGVALLGVVFLLLWAWLIGAFTRAFWIQDDEAQQRAEERAR